MSANLIAATAPWGATAETSAGVIIESLEETSRDEKAYLKDNVGQRTGMSRYDESIEVKLSGELTTNSPFVTKLGANVTLSSTIVTNHLYNSNTGRTLVQEVKRNSNREDWKKIEVDIEVLPFFG